MKRLRQLWHALVIESLAIMALVFAIGATTVAPSTDAMNEEQQPSGNGHITEIIRDWAGGIGG